jgi:hypothetical protein
LVSDSLPDSDPALVEDLATHVQSVLPGISQRSSSNSESTITPAGIQLEVENQDPPISSMPLTPSEDISFLVEIRRQHQTKEAEKGVRLANGTKALGHHWHSSSGASGSEDPITERRLLAQKIHEIVKAVDGEGKNTGSSTGLNKRIRWTKTPGLYSPSLTLSSTHWQNEHKSGNSANASELEVAQKAANLVSPLC